MLGSALFACLVYQTYGCTIAQQRFRPAGFTVELGLKDIDLTLQTGADSTTPLPLASLQKWRRTVDRSVPLRL